MSFVRDGYEIIEFGHLAHEAVRRARIALIGELGELETYHLRVPQGDDIRNRIAARDLLEQLPATVIEAELSYFRSLIGGDIHIQRVPYLRLSRPHEAQDNIGFHRDTWYGDTPYEVSVWIPLTDTDEGNAISVSHGSHVRDERDYPLERYERADVPQGGEKHSLGFIYSPPKRLKTPVPMTPLPMQVGQMLVFSLSLLHGQEVNRSTKTRFSMDCRLANSLAPIKLARSRDAHYYQKLCSSPVTQAALDYYAAQPSGGDSQG